MAASSAAWRWPTGWVPAPSSSPSGRRSSTAWTPRCSSPPASPWWASCWRWPSCPGGRPPGRRRPSWPRRVGLPSPGELAQPGLRERKKARTRAAIQRHALRLFRGQGYDETTVSEIAEAAEVSESTFFRYFPTKEDVVLWDDFDPRIAEV